MKEMPPQPHPKDCKCDRCEAERSSKAWMETAQRSIGIKNIKETGLLKQPEIQKAYLDKLKIMSHWEALQALLEIFERGDVIVWYNVMMESKRV